MKRAFLAILAVLLCLAVLPASAWGPPDYIPWEDLPEGLRLMLDGTFVQALANEDGLWFVLTETPDGYTSLRIFKAADGGYDLQAQSAPLPEMNGKKPAIHAGYASVTVLYSEMLLYTFEPDYWGIWRLTAVQGEYTYGCMRYWLMERDAWHGHVLYAENTSPRLSEFDPELFPPDFGDAANTLNTEGYALVDNPNPADRLHLRAEPDTKAESKGKYYNGTPVYIVEDLGNWAKVSVAGVEGYMMKQYLAAGADMLNVYSAFAELFIKPELAGQDLNVYLLPDGESALAGVSYDRGPGRVNIHVIGIVGEDWVHVITDDGLAGYMPAEDFYPGNG